MSDSRTSLISKINNAVLTGARRTTAVNVRQLLTDIVNGVSNINDDDNQPNGYLGLDGSALATISHLAAPTPVGNFLRDDGTYAAGSGSSYTFGSGLTLTGAAVTNDLITGITGGQTIIGGTAVGDGLIYKSTVGNGTSTALAHSFVGGNNGATTGLRVYNDGTVVAGPGSAAKNSSAIGGGLRVTQGSAIIDIGQGITAGTSGIWLNGNLNPTQPAIMQTSGTLTIQAATGSNLTLGIGGIQQLNVTTTAVSATKNLAAGSGFLWDNTNTLLYIGGTSGAFTNTKLQVYDNVNSFSQMNYMNLNSGSLASSDGVWTADTGTNTTNYVNVGINSSTFSDATFSIGGALDSYLYSNGGNMLIGAQSAKDVVFFTGGTLVANEVGRFKGVGGRLFLTSSDTAGTDFPNVARTSIFTSTLTTGADADTLVNLDLATTIINTSTRIKYLNSPTVGSGYTNGTYTSVSLTGGTGSGAVATIVVANSVIYSVTLTSNGSGYTIGDSLTTANTNIGGTGSGFAIAVNSLGFNSRAFGLRSLVWDAIIGSLTVGRGGGGNVANTAVGGNALFSNQIGVNNTAIGSQALLNNLSGNNNTSIGRNTLLANKYGTTNTAVGFAALSAVVDTDSNTAIGASSLNATTGSQNCALGLSSGLSLTTGSNNVFIGYNSGNNVSQLVTAANSIAIGATTFTTASNSVVIGNGSMTTVAFGSGKLNFTLPATAATIALVSGSTLTLLGAFNLSLTTTAASTPTFPAGTGTLAYLAGTNTWAGLNTFSNATGVNVTNNVAVTTAGKGLTIKEGTGGRSGTATLAAGTVTVANTTITANSRIFITPINNTNAGALDVTLIAATSFTIRSASPTDTRVIHYFIIEGT